MVIDSMNFYKVAGAEGTFQNANKSVTISLNDYKSLAEYGADSVKNICNSEGFYITKDAPVSSVILYINLQRPCLIRHMSFDFDYTYNDNDEIVLKNLPKSIKVEKDRPGSIYNNLINSKDFTSEHFIYNIGDTFTFRPFRLFRLTFFVNNNTSDDYLFKIKNFKISYKQYTDF